MPHKRILVIDDSKAICAFVRSVLAPLQYDVIFQHNGQLGLDHLAQDKEFDLILLDWEMPVMDGPETILGIVNLAPEIPVCMMTSKNSMENISQMISLGAKEYIMKPYTKDILIEKISLILSESRAA